MNIEIDLGRQTLKLEVPGEPLRSYRISSAVRGAGEQRDSFCTPRGLHRSRAMIGAGQPRGAVFLGRRPTGEIYNSELARAYPGRDWILTRILWLCGCEPGRNRLGRVDSMQRYIYIHGTADEARLGTPASHGCVRMANHEVAELFELVQPGCPVLIHE